MSVETERRPRLFYGWYIVGGRVFTQLMMGMLMFHSFGTYVTLMQADFGWSRTTFSIAFAMQRAESGILGPIQGWAIDTYGPQRIMMAGMVLFAAGFMMLSQVDAKWTFYLAFMLIAIGASLGSFLSLTVAIVNWFRRRRTMALGLLSLGFAVGGFAATPVALLIEGVGWRAAAFGSGVAVLLIGLPLARLVKHRPEDHGLLPDGAPSRASLSGDPDDEEDDDDDDDDDISMTTREALRTQAFWLISFGQASALLVIGALMVHLVVYVSEDLDYGLALATFAITVQTIGQVVGQLIGSYVGDRLPKRPLIVGALLGHAVAIFVLAMASTLPLVYVAVAINGTAWGLRAPLQMAIRADYFGRKSFGTIMGFSSLVIMSGMIVGPTFAGVMYDQTGSYQLSFIVLSVFAALGALLFAFARPPAGGPTKLPTVKPPTPVRRTTEAGEAGDAAPAPTAPRVPTAPRAERERRAG